MGAGFIMKPHGAVVKLKWDDTVPAGRPLNRKLKCTRYFMSGCHSSPLAIEAGCFDYCPAIAYKYHIMIRIGPGGAVAPQSMPPTPDVKC